MKTMKRSLALILAFVMAFSVFGMLASPATAIEDFDEVDPANQLALQVLMGLGIVQGYDTGDFEPEGTFTRAHGATIIAYLMLGKEAADGLANAQTGSIFSDVPDNHWAAGYISFCAGNDIIKGYGDGTFGPDDQLTYAAFFTLLLKALGWGQLGEYEGAGWDTRAVVKAIALGLREAITFASMSNPMQRQHAIQAAFNALEEAMVALNLLGVYTPSGAEFMDNFGATYMDGSNHQGYPITLTAGVFKVNGVTITADDPMLVGRTAAYWIDSKGKNLLTGTGGDDFVLLDREVGLTDAELASLTASTPSAPVTLTGYFKDGASGAVNAATIKTLLAKKGVEYIAVDSPASGGIYDGIADKLIFIEKTVETVGAAGVTVSAAGRVTIAGTTNTAINGGATMTTDTVFGYEGLVKDDVILVVAMNTNNGYFVEKAESVTGLLASYNTAGGIMTLGSDKYEVTALTGGTSAVSNLALAATDIGKEFTIWLDKCGYIAAAIKVTPDVDTGFAYVLDGRDGVATPSGSKNYADLVLETGEAVWGVETSAGWNTHDKKIVRYTINKDGQYELAMTGFTQGVAIGSSGGKLIAGSGAGFIADNSGNVKVSTDKSKFVYVTKYDASSPTTAVAWAAVTDVRNMPVFSTDTDCVAYITDDNANNTVAFAYINKLPDPVYGDETALLYITNYAAGITTADGVQLEALDVVTGEVKTVLNTSGTAISANGLWLVTYSSENVIDSATSKVSEGSTKANTKTNIADWDIWVLDYVAAKTSTGDANITFNGTVISADINTTGVKLFMPNSGAMYHEYNGSTFKVTKSAALSAANAALFASGKYIFVCEKDTLNVISLVCYNGQTRP